MDKQILRRISLQSIALMLTVITFSYALHQNTMLKISATDLRNAEASEASKKFTDTDTINIDKSASVKEQNPSLEDNDNREISDITRGLWKNLDPNIISKMGEQILVIKKPKSSQLNFTFEDIYISKSIRIHLMSSEAPMDSSFIGRINGEVSFISDPVYTEIEAQEINVDEGSSYPVIYKDYGSDFVQEINLTNNLNDEIGLYETEILLVMDDIYTHSLMEDEAYYYIGLKKPREVYERILVIDAGHGGKDAGALSVDKNTYEKDINLKILLYLKEMLDKEDIKVYYTRLGDDKVFLRPRVELANAVECDFFISIHCNASIATSPHGSEMLYYDTVNNNISNKALAKILSQELEEATSLNNRGLMKRQNDDIFILENALVPAVIVETGYITNQGDLSYLKNSDNQKAIAKGIYNGILRAYNELQPE